MTTILTPFQIKVLRTIAVADAAGKEVTIKGLSSVIGAPEPEIIDTLVVLKAHALIEGECRI